MQKNVAIIGAGSSGIACLKCMKYEGHKVTCFEKLSYIGGNWAYNEKDDHSSIYETIFINTTKENMCYSDFPFDVNQPYYLHHTEILKYFNDYVDKFDIRKDIQFNTRVDKVEPVGDGTWTVTTTKLSENGKALETSTSTFDAVCVCSGHHWDPKMVTFPGEDEFTKGGGKIIHSHYYKKAAPFANKKVVIVGIGNSAADLAVEISKLNPGETYVSIRRGALIVPKYNFGIPSDHLLCIRFWTWLPMIVSLLFSMLIMWLAQGSVFLGQKPGLKLIHPTVNHYLLDRVKNGNIKVKPNIKRLEKGKVVFEDGTEVEADIVIYATGYLITFPFLSQEVFPVKENVVRVYKFVVPPKQPGLFFIGLVQPLGSIMPIAELQSRWIARVIAGHCKLPSENEMEREVDNKMKQLQFLMRGATRHTVEVTNFIEYMDEIASLFGAKPQVLKHLDIFFPLVFGPPTPVQYRLDGPGKWANAKEEIVKMWKHKPKQLR